MSLESEIKELNKNLVALIAAMGTLGTLGAGAFAEPAKTEDKGKSSEPEKATSEKDEKTTSTKKTTAKSGASKTTAKSKAAAKKPVEEKEEPEDKQVDDGLDDPEETAGDEKPLTVADIRNLSREKMADGVLRKDIKQEIADAGLESLNDLTDGEDDEAIAALYEKIKNIDL